MNFNYSLEKHNQSVEGNFRNTNMNKHFGLGLPSKATLEIDKNQLKHSTTAHGLNQSRLPDARGRIRPLFSAS